MSEQGTTIRPGHPPAAKRLAFGDFELDMETLELRRDGHVVPLRPMASRALAVLVSRPERLTTRRHLQRALWGGAIVDWDAALNQYIRQIRKALGDRSDRPTYVETVHGRGYRLIAAVRPSAGPADRSGLLSGAARGTRYRLRPFLAGFGAALASIVAVIAAICSLVAPA